MRQQRRQPAPRAARPGAKGPSTAQPRAAVEARQVEARRHVEPRAPAAGPRRGSSTVQPASSRSAAKQWRKPRRSGRSQAWSACAAEDDPDLLRRVARGAQAVAPARAMPAPARRRRRTSAVRRPAAAGRCPSPAAAIPAGSSPRATARASPRSDRWRGSGAVPRSPQMRMMRAWIRSMRRWRYSRSRHLITSSGSQGRTLSPLPAAMRAPSRRAISADMVQNQASSARAEGLGGGDAGDSGGRGRCGGRGAWGVLACGGEQYENINRRRLRSRKRKRNIDLLHLRHQT